MLLSRELSDKQLARFCYQISIAFKAGLPLTRIFEMIEQQITYGKIKKLATEVRDRLKEGDNLATALARTGRVPRLFLEFVAAAELSGQLENTLVSLSSYYDRRVTVRRAIISSLIPAMITITVGYGVILLLVYLQSGIEGVHRILLKTIYLFGFILAIYFIKRLVTPLAWALDFLKAYLPILKGTFRKLAISRFTRTLAILLGSGVAMPRAIDRAIGTTSNLLMERSLRQCLPPLLQGESFSESLSQSPFITPFIHQMIVMADETGKYEETLARVADTYEAETQSTLENLPKVLLPVVTIMLGIFVLYFAYRFYSGLLNQALSVVP